MEAQEIGVEWGPRRFRMSIESRYEFVSQAAGGKTLGLGSCLSRKASAAFVLYRSTLGPPLVVLLFFSSGTRDV